MLNKCDIMTFMHLLLYSHISLEFNILKDPIQNLC